MTNIAEQTLASLVTEQSNTVPVLEKYNLDFCCKGKRTLAQACAESGLSIDAVTSELSLLTEADQKKHLPFTDMTAEQLIGHILIHHHFYVKQSMPYISLHLEKVAGKHGQRFPYMVEVLSLFTEIQEDMTAHMQKEELVLFPRIREVENTSLQGTKAIYPEGFISMPVGVMEHEHDAAGTILYQIRQLTNNYTAPEEACTTFKVCLNELKAFEEDLHRHVHLENNILFPLAKKMQAQMTNC